MPTSPEWCQGHRDTVSCVHPGGENYNRFPITKSVRGFVTHTYQSQRWILMTSRHRTVAASSARVSLESLFDLGKHSLICRGFHQAHTSRASASSPPDHNHRSQATNGEQCKHAKDSHKGTLRGAGFRLHSQCFLNHSLFLCGVQAARSRCAWRCRCGRCARCSCLGSGRAWRCGQARAALVPCASTCRTSDGCGILNLSPRRWWACEVGTGGWGGGGARRCGQARTALVPCAST
jgi:hypothetical protein